MASQIGPALVPPAISLGSISPHYCVNEKVLMGVTIRMGLKACLKNHDSQLSPIPLSNGQAPNGFQDLARYVPSSHKIWCQANWLFCFGAGRNWQAYSQQVPTCCSDSFHHGPDPWTLPREALWPCAWGIHSTFLSIMSPRCLSSAHFLAVPRVVRLQDFHEI